MELRALLIGIQDYGDGFSTPLSVVAADLEIMGTVLDAAGFSVTTVRDTDVEDAVKLRDRIVGFCRDAGPDSLVLLYYTGHGLQGDDRRDYIVSPGTSYRQAYRDPLVRVPTDLRPDLEGIQTQLVVFVIDACRDDRDKSASGWGGNLDAGDRFVRFLGCGPGGVCQIIEDEGSQVSVFTKALAESIQGASQPLSLYDVFEKTKNLTLDFSNQKGLRYQEPRYSAEVTSDVEKVLNTAVVGIADSHRFSVNDQTWPFEASVDPTRFHVVVVNSEFHAKKARSKGVAGSRLEDLVGEAIVEAREEFWLPLRNYWSRRALIGGKSRPLGEVPNQDHIVSFAVSADGALNSAEMLEPVVRAVVEADLAVFDLTGFEPVVMLLMGIRSSARHGVTVCTHGGGWQPGTPLTVDGKVRTIPFNLQDLSITSHSYPPDYEPGEDDPVVKRLRTRIIEGFRQMAEQPAYLDLPGFELLRRVGPSFEAGREVGVDEQQLPLCPFSPKYTQNNLPHLKGGTGVFT